VNSKRYKVMLQVYNIDKAEYDTLHTEEVEIADRHFVRATSGNSWVKGHYAKHHLAPYFDMLHEYAFICIVVREGSCPLYHRHKRQTILYRNYNE